MKRLITIFCVLCFVVLTISSGLIQSVSAEVISGGDFKVDAKSAYLIDFDSKKVLFEQNSKEHLPVASMVKLMTILLTFEEIDAKRLSLDDKIPISTTASGMGGSQVFIDPNVEYKCEDLLKSVIVASANDASVALAEKISGSEEAFVNKMNARAKELGMLDTNYVNCTGLPAPSQYSCAKDIAILDHQVINHKDYFKYSTIWMDELVHPSGRKTELVNTNKLIRYFKGCDCGKTGSTSEAGYCLTASAKRDDMRLIGTVIGAKDSKARFNETSKLLNFGFANFEKQQIIEVGQVFGDVQIKKSKVNMVNAVAKNAFSTVVKKGEKAQFDIKLELPQTIIAPINIGDNVGKAIITQEGEVVAEIELISNAGATKLTFGEALSEVIENWGLQF